MAAAESKTNAGSRALEARLQLDRGLMAWETHHHSPTQALLIHTRTMLMDADAAAKHDAGKLNHDRFRLVQTNITNAIEAVQASLKILADGQKVFSINELQNCISEATTNLEQAKALFAKYLKSFEKTEESKETKESKENKEASGAHSDIDTAAWQELQSKHDALSKQVNDLSPLVKEELQRLHTILSLTVDAPEESDAESRVLACRFRTRLLSVQVLSVLKDEITEMEKDLTAYETILKQWYTLLSSMHGFQQIQSWCKSLLDFMTSQQTSTPMSQFLKEAEALYDRDESADIEQITKAKLLKATFTPIFTTQRTAIDQIMDVRPRKVGLSIEDMPEFQQGQSLKEYEIYNTINKLRESVNEDLINVLKDAKLKLATYWKGMELQYCIACYTLSKIEILAPLHVQTKKYTDLRDKLLNVMQTEVNRSIHQQTYDSVRQLIETQEHFNNFMTQLAAEIEDIRKNVHEIRDHDQSNALGYNSNINEKLYKKSCSSLEQLYVIFADVEEEYYQPLRDLDAEIRQYLSMMKNALDRDGYRNAPDFRKAYDLSFLHSIKTTGQTLKDTASKLLNWGRGKSNPDSARADSVVPVGSGAGVGAGAGAGAHRPATAHALSLDAMPLNRDTIVIDIHGPGPGPGPRALMPPAGQ